MNELDKVRGRIHLMTQHLGRLRRKAETAAERNLLDQAFEEFHRLDESLWRIGSEHTLTLEVDRSGLDSMYYQLGKLLPRVPSTHRFDRFVDWAAIEELVEVAALLNDRAAAFIDSGGSQRWP